MSSVDPLNDVEDDFQTNYAPEHEIEDILVHVQRRFVVPYPEDGSHKRWMSPKAVILFETGDRATIIDIVIKTLVHPIGIGQVASVLVHEPLRELFIKRIRAKMQAMDERVKEHPNFKNTMQLIRRMRPQIIYMEEFDNIDAEKNFGHMNPNSPIVVCDFPQSYFGTKPTGIITLNTFRTLNESARLCNREGLDFQVVSVWTKKMSEAYELANRLKNPKYFTVNCLDAPFGEVSTYYESGETVSTIIKNMHFEIAVINENLKVIAFPLKN